MYKVLWGCFITLYRIIGVYKRILYTILEYKVVVLLLDIYIYIYNYYIERIYSIRLLSKKGNIINIRIYIRSKGPLKEYYA